MACDDVCETKLEKGQEIRRVMKAATTYDDDDAPVAVETTCN